MIRTVITHNENDVMIRSERGGVIEYDRRDPDEFQEWLSTKCLSLDEVEIVWMDDMSLYCKDMIALLYYMEYKDVSSDKPSVSSMPVRSFKYTIDMKNNAYTLIVRMRKVTLYIYNANNLLGNLDHIEIFKSWGSGTVSDLRDMADAIYRGIEALSGFQEKKTPYTLSMVASRKWKTREKLYRSPFLADCNKYDAPGGDKRNLAEYIRESYQAGWNYVSEKPVSQYKNCPGFVYDINSSYPYIMAGYRIPWGEPTPFKGNIPKDVKNNKELYYFVRVKIQFDLKSGQHLPYIRKRGDFRYRFQDYLKTSDIITERRGQMQRTSRIIDLDGKLRDVCPEFVFTKTDYELIHRHYDIRHEEVLDGVWFHTSQWLFHDFITELYDQKLQCEENHDAGGKRVAKMIMNSVAGGLAKRPKRTNIIYDEDMNITTQTTFNTSPSYIHMASAILSYARERVYEAACANYDTFLYSDTDSLHLLTDKPVGIELDDTKLGAWKVEYRFVDACYFKRKCYTLKLEDGSYHMIMAGVNHEYKELLQDIFRCDKSDWEIIAALRTGKYGSAQNLTRMHIDKSDPTYGWVEFENEPDTWTYSPDFERLKKLINEVRASDDRTSLLMYINYPTGGDQCKNFKITHYTEWRALT